MTFLDTTTADNATITANGGVSGAADGGVMFFEDRSRGSMASISLLGNGELDFGNSRATPGVTIDSAGDAGTNC